MKICRSLCLLFTLLIVLPTLGQDKPKPIKGEDFIEVPAIGKGLCVSNAFQSNMVLQRDKPIHIWGWATQGEKVTVSFAGSTASATAGNDRAWKVTLDAQKADERPQTLTVKGAADTLTLDNILIGDVWVLGGQSNMEFELAKVENGHLEIISANFPKIRVLTIPYGEAPGKHNKSFPQLYQYSDWFKRHFKKGSWDVCTPHIAKDLSAIGYVFARRVHKAAGVPIGVIDASRGGTALETWTPQRVLRKLDSEPTKAMLANWDEKVANWDPQADLDTRIKKHRDWVQKQKKAGKTIPADRLNAPTDLRPGPIADHNHPSSCYGGMIAPLKGLSIKGAIFHQGFNNAFTGQQGIDMYRDVFPAMITAWRSTFNDPDLPFGILSLCTAGDPQTLDNYSESMFDAGVGVRAAQYKTFENFYKAGDKNIGFASTYDLRRRWYHPQVKLPAGERIARWALATQYGFNERQIAWRPAMITSIQAKDGALIVNFDQDVMDPQDGAMLGFAIADESREFHPAKAEYFVEGKDHRNRPKYNRKKLVLTSLMVDRPIHYRFAWSRNPLANVQLTGNRDVPLATQKSDDWGLEQVPLKVINSLSTHNDRANRSRILGALRDLDKQRRIAEAKALLQQVKE